MRAPASVRSPEDFGQVRLSYFFMRDFVHSEIASLHGMANLPDDPDVAIAGRGLCERSWSHCKKPLGAFISDLLTAPGK